MDLEEGCTGNREGVEEEGVAGIGEGGGSDESGGGMPCREAGLDEVPAKLAGGSDHQDPALLFHIQLSASLPLDCFSHF